MNVKSTGEVTIRLTGEEAEHLQWFLRTATTPHDVSGMSAFVRNLHAALARAGVNPLD